MNSGAHYCVCCWISIFSTVMSGFIAVASCKVIFIYEIPLRPTVSTLNTNLDCLGKRLVMINRVAVRLYCYLLLDPGLNYSISFRFVLEIEPDIRIITNLSTTIRLTVIVSTVLVLLLTVCEEIISPSAVKPPSASPKTDRLGSTAANVDPS